MTAINIRFRSSFMNGFDGCLPTDFRILRLKYAKKRKKTTFPKKNRDVETSYTEGSLFFNFSKIWRNTYRKKRLNVERQYFKKTKLIRFVNFVRH
jgi:hypothetical protein